MLSCTDIMKFGCINSLLHRFILQDSVWEHAFIHNSRKDVSLVMQNRWLQKKWEKLNPNTRIPGIVNRSDTLCINEGESLELCLEDEEPLKPDALVFKIAQDHSALFTDFTILYRVNEKQGWYMTPNEMCYYIFVDNYSRKEFRIIYARLHITQLELLIKQTMSSPVLLPLPGTVSGENGFYIDKTARVAKWEVNGDKWIQIPFV